MPRPPHRRVASAVTVAAVMLAACTSSTASPNGPPDDAARRSGTVASGPASSSGGSGAAADPTSPEASDGTVATAPAQAIPDQTATSWGHIWNELPNELPISSVGRVSQLSSHDGSSGAFDVDAPAEEVSPALQAALEGAHFSTLSMSGPFEDGSVIIESADPDASGCKVQTRIARRAGGSRVTILYGAACPFPMK